MRRNWFKLTILASATIGMLSPIVACTKKVQTTYSYDGSNWIGVRSGKFYDSDFDIDDETNTITYKISLNIHAKNLVIPNYVNYNGKEYKVQLGEGCFLRNHGIVGYVELNDFISEIPNFCFCQCYSLTNVIFHTQPTSIGDYAFYDTEIESLCLTSPTQGLIVNPFFGIKHIGKKAFYNCWLEGSITFGPSLEETGLGEGAFYGCININQINMAQCTITTIPKECFRGCQLLMSIILPPTISKIDSYAFYKCVALQKVYLQKNGIVLNFGDYAFADCSQLVGFSRQFIIDQIGDFTFYYDSKLVLELFLDSYSTRTINRNAFSYCTQITKITFTDNVRDVKSRAFADCTNLSILDFSHCDANYLNEVDWDGTEVFDKCSPNGIIYIKSGQIFSSEWKAFFEENGIHIKEHGDENGWIIKQKDDIPEEIILPEDRDIDILLDDQKCGETNVSGFSWKSDYTGDLDWQSFSVSAQLNSNDGEEDENIFILTPFLYKLETKEFDVNFKILNHVGTPRFTVHLNFFYRSTFLKTGDANFRIHTTR